MIRVRQVGKTRLLRRRLYEVNLDNPGRETWTKRTSDPVILLETHVGVAEASAMIRQVNELWDRDLPDWVVGWDTWDS